MPISFQCEGCQASLNVAEQYAGKQANCPQCGAAFIVPQPASAPAAGTPTPAPTAPSQAPAVAGGGFPGIATGKKPKRSGSPSSIGAGSAIGPAPSPGHPGPGRAPTAASAAPAARGAADVIGPGSSIELGGAAGSVAGLGPPSHGQGSVSALPAKRFRRGGKWLSAGVTTYPILGVFTATLGIVAFGYYAVRLIQTMSKIGFKFDLFFRASLLLLGIASVTIVTSFSCFVAADYLKSYWSDQ